jgi:ABC-type siderophore export system fused ATPase/permease subunit
MVPWRSRGATIGKTIFTCVYIKKHLLQNQQANFNNLVQIIRGEKELKIAQKKGQVLFQGEIITEMQK